MYKSRLRNIRENTKCKQSEIAKEINIHRARYSQYETELDIFPVKHLNQVCNYFDISLDYIFEFTDIKNYPNKTMEINIHKSMERLKSLRKENKLTQSDLAIILGCSYGTIAGYESGRYIIATSFLYTICKKYKVSADYLLGKIDTPKYLK